MEIAKKATKEIFDFWFGALDENGWIKDERFPLWFGGRAEDDAVIRERFGDLVQMALDGQLAHWAEVGDGNSGDTADAQNMALILLTDQFTRVVHRGTAAAFAGDETARAVCKAGIAAGRDKALPPAWRLFYYLPLEHSESLPDQTRCVELYKQLKREHPEQIMDGTVDYAQQHYDLIERFGRFPHRNAALGRENTEEETRYLAESRQHFGQRGR